jgi:hypothetical protein
MMIMERCHKALLGERAEKYDNDKKDQGKKDETTK